MESARVQRVLAHFGKQDGEGDFSDAGLLGLSRVKEKTNSTTIRQLRFIMCPGPVVSDFFGG